MNLPNPTHCARAAAAAALALAAAALPFAARAEPTAVTATGFVAKFHHELKSPPGPLFEAIGHVERWWSAEHTYSSDAANLSMGLEAGNCFCERWAGGSVQHGRVVLVMRDRYVRIDGAFGPLQSLAVNAVLTFTIKAVDGHAVLDATYRVGGPPDAGLDKLAPAVDGVIGEQVGRLVKLVDDGKP
jgi:uncharacterized protein YndB with AHSA1/START domain